MRHRSTAVNGLEHTVSSILARLDHVEKTNAQLSETVVKQAQENAQQSKENVRQAQEIALLKTVLNAGQHAIPARSLANRKTLEPDTRSQFTAFACTGQRMNISCPDERLIYFTGGTYGQYASACTAASG